MSPTQTSNVISSRVASPSAQEVIRDGNFWVRCWDAMCVQHMADALVPLQWHVCERNTNWVFSLEQLQHHCVNSLTLSWSFAKTCLGVRVRRMWVRNVSSSKCLFSSSCSVGGMKQNTLIVPKKPKTTSTCWFHSMLVASLHLVLCSLNSASEHCWSPQCRGCRQVWGGQYKFRLCFSLVTGNNTVSTLSSKDSLLCQTFLWLKMSF